MATPYAIASTVDGGIKYSDGSVKYPSVGSIPASGYGTQYASNPTNYAAGYRPLSQPSAPAPTQQPSGGGGGGGEPSVYQANINGQNQIFNSREEYERGIGAVKGSIESGFNDYFSSLDKQLGLLPEQQKNYEEQVGNQYSSQAGGLQTGQTNTLADLTNTENKVTANKVSSLRDLTDNIRNQIQAGNTFLGARGAGDSSAGDMMSFAYTQLGNKQRGGIMKTANESLADIGLRKNQVINTFNDQMKQLGEWKANQILSITQQINQAKARIEELRSQGHLQKGQAMAQLNTQIMQNAYAKLQQLDQQAANFQQGLQQWAQTHATNLSQYQQMLAGQGNVQAPTLEAQPLGGINYGTGTNSGLPSYTNYSATGQKKYDQYGRLISQ